MLKDLMVHLDGGADDAHRLGFAEALADRYKAHIGALFVNAYPGFSISADAAGTGAIAMAELVERATAEGDSTEKTIRKTLEGLRFPYDLQRIDAVDDQAGYQAARAALLAAPERDPGPIKTVVIGWNGSREAARAVAEAMPFLEKAAKVVVVTAEKHLSEDTLDTRLASHLDRHGVKVTLNE